MIYIYERCEKHNIRRLAGVQCYQCAQEAATADRLHAIVETLHIHSVRMDRHFDDRMILLARIADQDAQIAGLEGRVRRLERLIGRPELQP